MRQIVLLLAIQMFVTPVPAFGQQVVSVPTIQQETTLVLRGEGRLAVRPDVAIFRVGLEAQGETAAGAMNAMNEQMTAVLAALRKAGLGERDIQTGNVSVRSISRPGDRYQAAMLVTAIVREGHEPGKVIDAALSAGANRLDSLSFGTESKEEEWREARQAAIRNAMSKAQDYASAMGYSIVRIVNVAEPFTRGPSAPVFGERIVVTGGDGAVPISATTSIEYGVVPLVQHVDVTFELAR